MNARFRVKRYASSRRAVIRLRLSPELQYGIRE